jgi:F0F1-type ATP synthase assembly protein I
VTHDQPSQPNNNYGDGLSIAFELVATPAIFGLIGFAVDRWLGTTPLFILAFSGVAFVTVLSLTLWRYDAAMERPERERREARAVAGPRPARWERRRELHDGEVMA